MKTIIKLVKNACISIIFTVSLNAYLKMVFENSIDILIVSFLIFAVGFSGLIIADYLAADLYRVLKKKKLYKKEERP